MVAFLQHTWVKKNLFTLAWRQQARSLWPPQYLQSWTEEFSTCLQLTRDTRVVWFGPMKTINSRNKLLPFKRKLVKRTACIHPIGEGEIPTQLQGWPGARLTALMETSCPLLARVSAPREEDAVHPTATQRADPGHTTNQGLQGAAILSRGCAPLGPRGGSAWLVQIHLWSGRNWRPCSQRSRPCARFLDGEAFWPGDLPFRNKVRRVTCR